MTSPESVQVLQKALRRLPGVGPKTAQRMAFHLLERDTEGAREIADALKSALERVKRCERCNNFSEQSLCKICGSERRDPAKLCVVETPADLESMEQAGIYNGMYFVLMGHLAPLEGVGPEELGLPRLMQVVRENDIKEMILATNLTVEGEATAEIVGEAGRQKGIAVTRLARGLPMGGELEYMDRGTLEQAFIDRRTF